MHSFYNDKIKIHLTRAERIVAIKKEVTKGTYEIDSKRLANIMIEHLLNQSLEFHSPLQFH